MNARVRPPLRTGKELRVLAVIKPRKEEQRATPPKPTQDKALALFGQATAYASSLSCLQVLLFAVPKRGDVPTPQYTVRPPLEP